MLAYRPHPRLAIIEATVRCLKNRACEDLRRFDEIDAMFTEIGFGLGLIPLESDVHRSMSPRNKLIHNCVHKGEGISISPQAAEMYHRFVFKQFRTENRFPLFLELLWWKPWGFRSFATREKRVVCQAPAGNRQKSQEIKKCIGEAQKMHLPEGFFP